MLLNFAQKGNIWIFHSWFSATRVRMRIAILVLLAVFSPLVATTKGESSLMPNVSLWPRTSVLAHRDEFSAVVR